VHQSQFIAQYPKLFAPDADHVPLLVELYFDSARFPEGGPSVRSLGPAPTKGDRRYVLNRYLAERGDANIKSIDDLLAKSSFYEPAVGYQDKRATLDERNKETTLDVAARLQLRGAMRQLVMQCMGEQNLDALTYPTSNIPAPKLGAPNEPTVNGRPSNAWSILGQQGFPTITVPAGFTTEVYDRVPDPEASARPAGRAAGGEGDAAAPTKLVGPVSARLPVGIDFLARPFGEPTLLKIAAAYEDATRHREVPPGFGALAGAP
jgi:Asp-tRNA(Asn)/Glu-tRNA(Gln) amidotransferase A subunit family amidase